MSVSEIALDIIQSWLEKAPEKAMIPGVSLNVPGKEVAETAGENLGILFDKVYKAVEATLSK